MAEYDDDWDFVEASMARRQGAQNAQSVGRLEEINREKSSIRGPEHPRLLGGLRAVRNFGINDLKPFDFMGGGVLDVAENIAYGDQSTPVQYATAGLEVGGGALAGAVGRLSKFMPKRNVAPEGTRFNDNVVDMYDDDSVLDSIREMFGSNSVAEQRMNKQPGMFDADLSPDMTRKGWQAVMRDLEADPTNIQLQGELGGYGRMLRNQKMDTPGVSAFDESGGRLAGDELNVTDQQWAEFENYVSPRAKKQ